MGKKDYKQMKSSVFTRIGIFAVLCLTFTGFITANAADRFGVDAYLALETMAGMSLGVDAAGCRRRGGADADTRQQCQRAGLEPGRTLSGDPVRS